MKLATALPTHSQTQDALQIEMPCGLIGLGALKRFTLSPVVGSWPFLRLSSEGSDPVHFLAMEAGQVIPAYQVELGDEEAEALTLQDEQNAMVINLVTVHSSEPQYVTVNLIGPVVINRQTGIGRQVIILNSERYSTMHALVDERTQAAAA